MKSRWALGCTLETMSVQLYGDTTEELTAPEQAVLEQGGLKLEEQTGPDPLAETAVRFAAILESSLSTNELSERLGFGAGRIRQMVAERTLYSILLEGRRFVPIFQFLKGAKRLVPNIGRVNTALNPGLHPVEVIDWYTSANPDLYLRDDIDQTTSPLEWLKAGYDPEPVIQKRSQRPNVRLWLPRLRRLQPSLGRPARTLVGRPSGCSQKLGTASTIDSDAPGVVFLLQNDMARLLLYMRFE